MASSEGQLEGHLWPVSSFKTANRYEAPNPSRLTDLSRKHQTRRRPHLGSLEVDQKPWSDCRQRWRMTLDPRQAPIIVAIATGFCVGLVAYLAYLLFSFLTTA